MISVHELTKQFMRDGRPLVAVDRVSFQVHARQVYGLLGPNGAGKTTTMRMILGLMRPDSGYAEVDRFRTSEQSDEVKRRVGFISATSGIYQWLSGREVLTFFCDVYGLDRQLARQRIEQATRMLNLRSFIDQRCGTLSTGQRQRINLARAIVHDPPVLLLDEPTLGLDVVSSQIVFEYIDTIKEMGKAVILCTHRLEQAERICDQFGLMNEGRLQLEGTLDQLREQSGKTTLVEIFLDIIDSRHTTLSQ